MDRKPPSPIGIGLLVLLFVCLFVLFPFGSIDCQKCEKLMKADALHLREAIANVSRSQIGFNDTVNITAGNCGESMQLTRLDDCGDICPVHSDSCWILNAGLSCNKQLAYEWCIGFAGNMQIDSSALSSAGSQIKNGAIIVKKTGPESISLAMSRQ